MFWMWAAMAAESVQLMIEGETLAVYHGDYCSFPRVPGVTTKPKGATPPNIDWDLTFDLAATKEKFTGVLLGDPVYAAAPMPVRGDVALPEAAAIRAAVAACAPHVMDRPGLEELLRKSTPAQRSLLIRHLLNTQFKARPCAKPEREALIKLTGACQDGKCTEFLERLDAAGASCK